jgi:hypothetical protein
VRKQRVLEEKSIGGNETVFEELYDSVGHHTVVVVK